jgi:putative redox protein
VHVIIESAGLSLRGHLALPAAAGQGRVHGLVICHGFPSGPRDETMSGRGYSDLADRIALEAGWAVLTVNFRGTGDSEGDFSLGGWLADLQACVDVLVDRPDVDGVWVAGFSTGGSLALCAAGEDPRILGVAALAASADFQEWARDPQAFLAQARAIGLISKKGPDDVVAWCCSSTARRMTKFPSSMPEPWRTRPKPRSSCGC